MHKVVSLACRCTLVAAVVMLSLAHVAPACAADASTVGSGSNAAYNQNQTEVLGHWTFSGVIGYTVAENGNGRNYTFGNEVAHAYFQRGTNYVDALIGHSKSLYEWEPSTDT